MNGGMRIEVVLPSSPGSTSNAARTSVLIRSGSSATRSFSALILARLRCRWRPFGDRQRHVRGRQVQPLRAGRAACPGCPSPVPPAPPRRRAAGGREGHPRSTDSIPRARRQEIDVRVGDTVSCTRSNRSCTQASTSPKSRLALRVLAPAVRSFSSSARDGNGPPVRPEIRGAPRRRSRWRSGCVAVCPALAV